MRFENGRSRPDDPQGDAPGVEREVMTFRKDVVGWTFDYSLLNVGDYFIVSGRATMAGVKRRSLSSNPVATTMKFKITEIEPRFWHVERIA